MSTSDTRGAELIVAADDFGLTDATSRAIIDAHRGGVVTATSVLVVAPGALDRMRWLDDVPDLAVGAHLAMVGEDPPLLSAREVPTLVTKRGGFIRSWRWLAPRLAAHLVDPEDVRREFDAQLTAAAERHELAHLDTHQHVHLWPSIAEVVVGLAERHGVPRVRMTRSTGSGPKAAVIGRLSAALERRLDEAEVTRTDRYRGLDEAGRWTTATLVTAVAELGRREGSVEIGTHPGPADDPERSRYAWKYRWPDELAALRSPALRDQIARSGFTLTGSLTPAAR